MSLVSWLERWLTAKIAAIVALRFVVVHDVILPLVLLDLLSKMLAIDPKERCTAEHGLHHQWFKSKATPKPRSPSFWEKLSNIFCGSVVIN